MTMRSAHNLSFLLLASVVAALVACTSTQRVDATLKRIVTVLSSPD